MKIVLIITWCLHFLLLYSNFGTNPPGIKHGLLDNSPFSCDEFLIQSSSDRGFPIVTTPIFVTKKTPFGPSKEVQLAKYLLLKLPARQVEVGWLTLRECNAAGKSAIYGNAPSNGGVIIWNMLVITNLWMIFPAIKSPASWRISNL